MLARYIIDNAVPFFSDLTCEIFMTLNFLGMSDPIFSIFSRMRGALILPDYVSLIQEFFDFR